MKKILFALSFGLLAFVSGTKAQVNVNINIGNQPQWGPSGYNVSDAPFYYIPSINAYYDVTRSLFIILNGNRWNYVRQLPARYRNFDLYNNYKVVVNRQRPYLNNASDRRNYAQYRNVRTQQNIRDWRSANGGGQNNNGRPSNNQQNNGRPDRNNQRNNGGNQDNRHDQNNNDRHGNRQGR